jgi:ABC-2 type transport system ATP-binding protein
VNQRKGEIAMNTQPQVKQAISELLEQVQPPFIALQDLCKNYGTKTAVDHINLNVWGGEVFGFLGPNGAGKTTTIKMMVGLLRPSSGTVKISGYDMQKQPLQAKISNGYVPDTPNLYPKLSARELLHFVGDLYRMTPGQIDHRVEELLQLFSLVEAGDDPIDSYSHGMQQKASMAAALMHDPKVLVLDEPTVGLDPKSARLIKDVLRQFAARGSAVLVTTHILEIAERLCDRIGIMNHGRLIAVGTMEELRTMGRGETSLEDIFLSLTGGAEEAVLAEVLK